MADIMFASNGKRDIHRLELEMRTALPKAFTVKELETVDYDGNGMILVRELLHLYKNRLGK